MHTYIDRKRETVSAHEVFFHQHKFDTEKTCQSSIAHTIQNTFYSTWIRENCARVYFNDFLFHFSHVLSDFAFQIFNKIIRIHTQAINMNILQIHICFIQYYRTVVRKTAVQLHTHTKMRANTMLSFYNTTIQRHTNFSK